MAHPLIAKLGGRLGLRWRNLWHGHAQGAGGVLLAGLLFTEINVLCARRYDRFDLSDTRSYSLSEPSQRLLAGLDKPVRLTTLLASDTPFRLELKYLLESYRATSSRVTLQTIDPDRQPAEYLKTIRSIGVLSEEGNSGYADPALLIESGDKQWVVYTHQLSRTNDEGYPESTVEQRISEGILQVTQSRQDRVCFVTGHGEASVDDTSAEGLSLLQTELKRANIEGQRVPLDVPNPKDAIRSCPALALIGPTRPLPREHEQALLERVNSGVPLLALVDPLVTDDGRIQPLGLDALFEQLGVIAEPGFVIEEDPQLRLPQGMGETFFATPKTHPITQGLSTQNDRLDARVLLVAAQPLRPYPGSGAQTLLTTSEEGHVLSDLSTMNARSDHAAPVSLAFALASKQAPSVRGVIVGSSNPVRNRAFSDSAQFGNRIFIENVFAWLLKREGLISIPQRPTMSAGLNLSEESLSQLLRYVLLYLPFSAAGLGAWVLLRRSKSEQRSRASSGRDR